MAAAADDTDQAVLDQLTKIDAFAMAAPVFLPRDSLEAVRKLGKIIHEKNETYPNPNDEGTITSTTYTFENGLEIELNSFGAPLQIQFVHITIGSPHWPIKDGLNVGAPVERVLKVLGPASLEDAEKLTYTGTTEQIVFFVESGRITSVEIQYYAD